MHPMKSYEREFFEEKVQRLENQIEDLSYVLDDAIDLLQGLQIEEALEMIINIRGEMR